MDQKFHPSPISLFLILFGFFFIEHFTAAFEGLFESVADMVLFYDWSIFIETVLEAVYYLLLLLVPFLALLGLAYCMDRFVFRRFITGKIGSVLFVVFKGINWGGYALVASYAIASFMGGLGISECVSNSYLSLGMVSIFGLVFETAETLVNGKIKIALKWLMRLALVVSIFYITPLCVMWLSPL